MAITFDGVNKLAVLSAGTTTLSVRDLWSRWVDWFQTSDNSKFPLAVQQIGGNTIDAGAGTAVPIYVYLLNGWRVRPQEANHTLAVTQGVLLVDGGGDPFVDTLGAYVVRVNYQQPVQALTLSGGAVLTQQDKLDMAAEVRTELAPELANIDAEISSRLATASYAAPPLAADNAAAVWAKAVEGLTAEEMLRIMFAAVVGKRLGVGTATIRYFAQDGTTPRITFTPGENGDGVPILDGAP